MTTDDVLRLAEGDLVTDTNGARWRVLQAARTLDRPVNGVGKVIAPVEALEGDIRGMRAVVSDQNAAVWTLA